MKFIVLTLLSITILFSKSMPSYYNIVLYKTNQLTTANQIQTKLVKKSINEVSILKIHNNYLVIYKSFPTYIEAIKYKKIMKIKVNSFRPYIFKGNKKIIPILTVVKPKSKVEENKHNKKTNTIITKKSNLKNSFNFALIASPIKLQGDFSYGTNATSIDLENDLNIENTTTIIPKIEYKYKHHLVGLSYLDNSYSGSSILSSDTVLDSVTYDANTSISSNINTQWIELNYRFQYNTKKIGFDLHKFDRDITVSNMNNNTTIQQSYLYPTLYLANSHNLNTFNLSYDLSLGKWKEVSYLKYSIDINKDFNSIKHLNISLGYSNKEIDISDTSFKSNISYSGLFLKVTKGF